jgi:hypothetical protein
VVVFPAVSALISLVCVGIIARDAWTRPRPDKIAWAIAFTLFTIAAGAEVVGSIGSWTPTLARVYYLTGAVLVVWFLALGELYLLAASRIQRVAPGITLLVSAIAATLVLNAPVDETKLADDGWEAIERGTALTIMAIGINSLGSFIIVGGLVYSAIRFKRLGIQRYRMIGCLLIAAGTITVGMGGTLTRLGQHEYLYIAMAAGVAIIFAGYLQTRRPEVKKSQLADAPAPSPAEAKASVGLRPASSNGHHPAPALDPALALIESKLVLGDVAGLAAFCAEWSVANRTTQAMERDEAKRAWALRLLLSDAAQVSFDALPVPQRLQLTELYYEVFSVNTFSTRR